VQSGFANTSLDHQPKEHGIKRILILAMVTNACTESTGRHKSIPSRWKDYPRCRAAGYLNR
jgi:nicotinamidase-related amidase